MISKVFMHTKSDMDTLGAIELSMNPIVLIREDPHIEIRLESKSFNSSICGDDGTSLIIKSVPRIFVNYGEGKDVETIVEDIECLMQFFGLLIGNVSTAEDIRLSIASYPPFHFEHLKGDRKDEWSIRLGNTGYRVTMIPCDNDGNEITEGDILAQCKMIKIVKVTEVSNHYE